MRLLWRSASSSVEGNQCADELSTALNQTASQRRIDRQPRESIPTTRIDAITGDDVFEASRECGRCRGKEGVLLFVAPVGRSKRADDSCTCDPSLLQKLAMEGLFKRFAGLDRALRNLEARLIETVEHEQLAMPVCDACYIGEDLVSRGHELIGGRRWVGLGELETVQRSVETVERDQLLVGSRLDEFSLVENDDPVRFADGRQAMGDND